MFFRSDKFFLHPTAKRTGLVWIRPFKNLHKMQWNLYWMKLSFFERDDGRDASHFKISQAELPQFISMLQELLDEIANPGENYWMPERLLNSRYSDSERTSINFFNPAHTVFTKSGKLGIRQFCTIEGTWNLILFSPRTGTTTEMKNWHGSSMSLSIGHAKEFLSIIKAANQYMISRIDDEI